MKTLIFAFTFGAPFPAAPQARQTSPTPLNGGDVAVAAAATAPVAHASIAPRVSAPAPAAGLRTSQLRESERQVPEAWAPQDPADSLYRAARAALNRNDYDRAAGLFSEIVRR